MSFAHADAPLELRFLIKGLAFQDNLKRHHDGRGSRPSAHSSCRVSASACQLLKSAVGIAEAVPEGAGPVPAPQRGMAKLHVITHPPPYIPLLIMSHTNALTANDGG